MSTELPSGDHPLAFVDLQAQRRRLKGRIEAAMARVVEHGQFIMGPEIFELEQRLADFCGAKHVITCSSGTDAIAVILMALGVKSGDAVICPSFTFCATAEVVAWLGATPVFADVDEATFNIDPVSLRAAVEASRHLGLNPVGVIPVDLFGRPADYDSIETVAGNEGLWVLPDAAQSFGARYRDRAVGTIGVATATSFFPAKPLGCYGDGGAVFTSDDELAASIRSIRVHGQGAHKYDNERIGMAARMDTLQAAVLLEKLAIFPSEIVARQRIAATYKRLLQGKVSVPQIDDDCSSVWAQFTVKVTSDLRDGIQVALKADGIPTQVYYPRPLHQQTAYEGFPVAGNGLPVSDRLSQLVLSLPMHPYLTDEQLNHVGVRLSAALSAH